MSERRRHRLLCAAVLVLLTGPPVWADSAPDAVRQGNKLYADGNFGDAINKYNEALLERPESIEPKFNKANSYYRLDDLGLAMDLYKEAVAESKDMGLVIKAKYNLGNCHFKRGLKQRDSDLQKALEDLQTSIVNWRGVLDIDPEHKNAARNIEVARLIIKDIIDQLNRQKQQQDQQQQGQQGQQQQQGQQDQQQQDQSGQDQQDKQGQQNQSQQKDQQGQGQRDPNEPSKQDQSSDPNQAEQDSQQAAKQQSKQQVLAPDMTAQEILDKERRQKQQRQMLRTARQRKVEKDW